MNLTPRNRVENFFKDDPIKDFFDNFWTEFFPKNNFQFTYHYSPKASINETEDAYEVAVEVPGYSKEDITVSVEHDTLVIRAKQSSEEGKARRQTSLTRTVLLPQGVDSDLIQAELKNGLLKLSIPKPEGHKPKQIDIQGE